jgi:uncharacterized membrane protein YraQ (UPF0718 family)
MRSGLTEPSTYILAGLALTLAVIAYLKDPGLPMVGVKNGLSLLSFVVPRMIPALVLAGLMQVLVPQEVVARYFGHASGFKAVVIASIAGALTPGGPMVTVPLLVVLSNSGAGMPPLVAYMTSWSLFGLQRIISWEAPLMGWRFVSVRVLATFAFPLLAGWIVTLFYSD